MEDLLRSIIADLGALAALLWVLVRSQKETQLKLDELAEKIDNLSITDSVLADLKSDLKKLNGD